MGLQSNQTVSSLTYIAEILLPVPLSRCFDYRIDRAVDVGQRVLVAFGQHNRLTVGLVLGLRDSTPEDEANPTLKSVQSVLEDFSVVDKQWQTLITFASRYYAEPLGKAYKNAFPKRLRDAKPLTLPSILTFALTDSGKTAVSEARIAKRAKRQQQLCQYLSQTHVADEATLREQGFRPSDWNKAIESGYVVARKSSPFAETAAITTPNYLLNAEQEAVIKAVNAAATGFSVHLLYGVTGSGKTEVYMQLIAQTVNRGQQVLLLVPEIGLTPQMLARFSQRFGRRVAAYHSGLSETARRDVFLSAKSGDLPILIGTRSAVFVPLHNVGLILIDEEHDASYKQQEGFLYHARDLAIYRAKQCQIPIVMGSATPSLESIYHVNQGNFTQHQLSQRATSAPLPRIRLIDRRGGQREQILSDSVQQSMRQVLADGKQVLLFLNRRGFSPVMLCGACGWRSDCPSCSVFQTAHVSRRRLCCHHCGHEQALPLRCPDCGDSDLFFAGAGTEKLELQLQQQFPKHHVLRLDRDSQTTAKQLDAALQHIYDGEADIILGTQLVVKGHHFPNVDLVCVVDADSALFSSDFRAEERLYQQLIQVAGRAGRESQNGQVLIQSVVPEHAVFHALIQQDYWHYAEKLLQERHDYGLPPYRSLTVVSASALEQELLLNYLRAVKTTLLEHCEKDHVEALGPLPLAVEKVKNRYRAKLTLNVGDKQGLQKLLPLLQHIIQHYDKSQRFRTQIDVDAV